MSKSSSGRLLLNPHIILLGVGVALYAAQVLLFPAPRNPKYNINTPTYIALVVTLMGPWIATWAFGVTGYLRLESYARSIKDEASARPFRYLSRGIMFLVWGIIVATVISTFSSHHPSDVSINMPATIIDNYLYSIVPLAGFYYIWRAVQLLVHAKAKRKQFVDLATVVPAIALAALTAAYVYLVFTNPSRQVGVGTTPASYYLPDWLIVVSVIIPVVLSWTLGLLAVINIYRYQQKVAGFIYRRFMRTVAFGVIFIIGGSILVQALLSIGSQRLAGIGLGSALGIIYLFLVLQLAGYLLVSRGSKKLTLIETA